ncbi:hypothetical protein CPB85DRAFT_163908 [Mucidula mucida]|nr:hypothetical protein CPB85DRAFT_163908 [Mucidula mucida]
MSPTLETYGYNVAEVQSIMSANLHPAILLAFCHGIYTCIFFSALYYIIESTQRNWKRVTLAGIILFLWVSNTVLLSLNWEGVDQTFITHGTSLEAEFYFDDEASQLAIIVLRAFNVLIADLIVIWRCYVVYGGSLKIIAVPSLCVITETIGVCIVIVTSVADIHFVGDSQANWSLIYYSMTVATNSLCTTLILFRIMQVSGISAGLKTYRGIIEILIESAALYAVVYLALVIAYAYQYYSLEDGSYMTAYKYPVVMSYSITGIAPTLIIALSWLGNRVPTTHGRAHRSRTCEPMFSRSRSPCISPGHPITARKRRPRTRRTLIWRHRLSLGKTEMKIASRRHLVLG